MKKLLPRAALSLLALSSLVTAPLQAATTTSGFNVTVNLTSMCQINTAAAALNFGTYTAFGSAGTPAPTTAITFQCTQGFAPTTVALDTTPTLSTAGAAGLTTSGGGVIAGLLYSLSVAGVVSTTGSAATTTAGSGFDTKSYTITGGMASGQAGLSSTATLAATQARVLTLTF